MSIPTLYRPLERKSVTLEKKGCEIKIFPLVFFPIKACYEFYIFSISNKLFPEQLIILFPHGTDFRKML